MSRSYPNNAPSTGCRSGLSRNNTIDHSPDMLRWLTQDVRDRLRSEDGETSQLLIVFDPVGR